MTGPGIEAPTSPIPCALGCPVSDRAGTIDDIQGGGLVLEQSFRV